MFQNLTFLILKYSTLHKQIGHSKIWSEFILVSSQRASWLDNDELVKKRTQMINFKS